MTSQSGEVSLRFEYQVQGVPGLSGTLHLHWKPGTALELARLLQQAAAQAQTSSNES